MKRLKGVVTLQAAQLTTMKPSGILLIATFSSVCSSAFTWSLKSSNTFQYLFEHEGKDKADELLSNYKRSLGKLESARGKTKSRFLKDVRSYMSMADDLYNKDPSGQMQQELLHELLTLEEMEELYVTADVPLYLKAILYKIEKDSKELHGNNSLASDVRNIFSYAAAERHKSDLENFISMLDQIHKYLIRQAKLLDLLEWWKVRDHPKDTQLKKIFQKEKEDFIAEFDRFNMFLDQDK